MTSLVVAVGRGGAIGRGGRVPWRAPEDQAHFKRLTMDHVVVLGSATWASIGRPLAGRTFVVVSRRPLDLPDGVLLAPDPDAGLDLALERDSAPVVGGGTQIYEALLPRVARAYVTEVDEAVDGADAFFTPPSGRGWIETDRWIGDDPRLTFRVLDRQAVR